MNRKLLAAAAAAWIVAACRPPCEAAMLRHAPHFILSTADSIHDDLYLAGRTVEIQGTVDGDLVVAGQTITISGNVTGDVLAAGRDVTITGTVGGSVRAAGNSVVIESSVAQDVLAAGSTVTLGPKAVVGRDLLAASRDASVGGLVSRDVHAAAASLVFAGEVGGAVQAASKDVRLAQGAMLDGDLFYTSRHELTKAPGAVVRGRITRRLPAERRGTMGGPVIRWIRGFVGFFLLGLLFFLVFTVAARRSVETLLGSPGPSLGLGALLFFGIPLAACCAFFFGAVFGGWWIALFALAFFAFALALGYVLSAAVFGRWMLERSGRSTSGFVGALLLGLFVLGLVTLIPLLGKLVGFVAVLFGFGAIALAWTRRRPRQPMDTAAAAT